jgi:hypothetical protein
VTFLDVLNLFHTWMVRLFFSRAIVFALAASSKYSFHWRHGIG